MDVDLIIIGAGLAGLALAVSLRGRRVALVDTAAPLASTIGNKSDWDSRIYAISPANQRYLEDINIWAHLDPARRCSIRAMEIYGDRGGRLEFSAYDSGVAELAVILESSNIARECWQTVQRLPNLHLFCPAQPKHLDINAQGAKLYLEDGRTLCASLIIGADGAHSWTRAQAGISINCRPYQQHAVVANFRCHLPHQDTAVQWFCADGSILAFLPLPDHLISMVWSCAPEYADNLCALPVAELEQVVRVASHDRCGALQLITPPQAFPLRLMRASQSVAPRLALIGDAAHTIHPLTGHGINLGLQDAKALAERINNTPAHIDLGDVQWLRAYERQRKEEVLALQSATDGLQRLFATQQPILATARNFGLDVMNHFPPLRRYLARYAMG